jgi:pheromone a factor receptor
MARNTTKSRFIRLFLICLVLILIIVPYSVYPFYYFCSQMASLEWDYEWEKLYGQRKNIILKFPSNGQVHINKWGQVILGYVVFFVFGTGTDAYNTYRKMLLVLGLGKIFPALYVMRETGTSTPSSFISARTWTSTYVSKAKGYFSKSGSGTSTFGGSTFNNSVCTNSVILESNDNTQLRSISSTTPVLQDKDYPPTNKCFLKRIFTHRGRHQPILPIFSQHSTASAPHDAEKVVETVCDGFSAQAWAPATPLSRRNSEPVGVHVVREVHQNHEVRESTESKPTNDWMLKP